MSAKSKSSIPQKNQRDLYTYLLESGVFESSLIAKAFKTIDRADFVPDELRDRAYDDTPLPIGYHQTISQPSTVAFMLNILSPKEGQTILDIGSGSGWTTALLANSVGPRGRVIGFEIVPELVAFGQRNLAKYDFPQAEIRQAKKGELGWPAAAPFDRILVSAAASTLPSELIDQLKVGGRLVIPIGNSIRLIERVSEVEIDERDAPGFIFVPLLH